MKQVSACIACKCVPGSNVESQIVIKIVVLNFLHDYIMQGISDSPQHDVGHVSDFRIP